MTALISSPSTSNHIVDVLAPHCRTTMPDMFGEGTEKSDMPIEMYMKQDQGFFMKDVASDSWFKLPNEKFDDILDQTASSADAKQQLQQLKEYIDDFTFEQNDDAYVLTLKSKGDRFKDLIDSQVQESIQGLGLEENPLDNLTIDKVNYVLYIDKETFDTTKMDMNFDFKMKVEDEELAMTTKSVITYTDFNHLKTIDIPQNIIDNATEPQ